MVLLSSLLGLFAAAFIAATLIPFQSEIVFVALQLAGQVPVVSLVIVASIGNTLGALVNYYIGHGITRFEGKSWFPATPAQMARMEVWFARWGKWVLLVSWLPVGDVMTLVAGVMRTPVWLFLILVGIAKTTRYIGLALITAGLIG
ncbi:DedA family protein (plasmid) [Pseudorhodobacter turbinis]|uniref:DedA family protein n=1 Tax=Pseudorhodobacter turbinis TaxID=2500533 RepID=A0A4P8EJT9_9RHOB|nr:YqaA family protein [Pseudorhodobacter turbinis]QCO57133.1 DedA family protein [Pseudorhodobacter turbinis]